MIKPDQIRAARALLGWSQDELAHKVGLSLPGLSKLERGISDPRASTLDRIQRVFEEAGVEFIAGGVRWREP